MVNPGAVALDMTDLTSARGRAGAAGSGDHARTALAYVNYTNNDGNTRIDEYSIEADGTFDPRQPTRSARHSTSRTPITTAATWSFGPDGMLYIGTGDGGAGGDPDRRALDLGRMARQDAAHRPATQRRRGVHRASRQPLRRRRWRPSRDLVDRLAQPVALQLRPIHRRSVDRRRRPEPVGGGRRRLGGRRWRTRAELRVERMGGQPSVQRRSVTRRRHTTDPRVRARRRRLLDQRRRALSRGGNSALVGWYVFGDYCSSEVRALQIEGTAVDERGRDRRGIQRVGGPRRARTASCTSSPLNGPIYAVTAGLTSGHPFELRRREPECRSTPRAREPRHRASRCEPRFVKRREDRTAGCARHDRRHR